MWSRCRRVGLQSSPLGRFNRLYDCRRFPGELPLRANMSENDVHVVVSAAGIRPKKIRTDLNGMGNQTSDPRIFQGPQKLVGQRGSIRFLFDQDRLDKAIKYVNEAQDKKSAGSLPSIGTRSVSEDFSDLALADAPGYDYWRRSGLRLLATRVLLALRLRLLVSHTTFGPRLRFGL